ncbi:hypothetical protein EVA_07422 [gut metagenome]|uniref:Uncharacterized protein n=1 Tax=gut metagenome TaxID=749906 RepID=J9GAX1_9ZZZZ
MGIKERTYKFIDFKGLSVKRFEELCNLSNGYISSMRKGFGEEKLNNVLNAFPELNREWLLYGEGEMLRGGVIQQNQNGDNIHGDSVHVQNSNELVNVLKTQSEQLSKSQEQIDRLLAIIEKMQG